MKLQKVKASSVNKILKATCHKSGKLGFTKDAAEFLDLSVGKSAEVLMNDENAADKNLYIQIHPNQEDKDNFKISKAGEYFYINLKAFYDLRNEDYKLFDIVYNISKINIEGEAYFLFKRKLTGDSGEGNEE